MKKRILLSSLALLLMAHQAKADLFTITLEQGANSSTRTFKSVIDLFDLYEDGQLNTILSGYDKTQGAFGQLDFRGIPMNLTYANTTGDLRFEIPQLNIDLNFSGDGSQEVAFKKFKEYLKSNSNDLLHKIIRASVKSTPYDAVAGNPGSLMGEMTNQSFNAAVHAASSSSQAGAFFILSPTVSKHTVKHKGRENTTKTAVLPLGYTFRFENNWAFAIDLPLTYVDIDGSETYAAQLGFTLHVPLSENWMIFPSARIGATASEDALAGGILYSGTLTSRYRFHLSDTFSFDVINMAGAIKDYAIKVDKYDIKYDLTNYVFKNGVNFRYKTYNNYAFNAFFYDTRYTGDDLYIDAYDEVGISLSKDLPGRSFFTGMDLTASYTFGDHYKAYRVGLGFAF